MERHVRIFCKSRNIGEQDLGSILCEWCASEPMVDVHHIEARGMGGDPLHDKDDLNNLIGLGRYCHDEAEAGRISKKDLKGRVKWILEILERRRKRWNGILPAE